MDTPPKAQSPREVGGKGDRVSVPRSSGQSLGSLWVTQRCHCCEGRGHSAPFPSACVADAVVLGAAVGPWGAGDPGSRLAEPSQSPSPTPEPGLAPGSFCTGVVSKVSPFLSRLQGGRSNRVQIMKPKSCSRVISHLCQMHFITVLGGVSKCWAGGSSVHPAGPTSAGAVARLRVAPQESWGDQGCSRVSKQSCSFPWVMCVSSTGTWSLGE